MLRLLGASKTVLPYAENYLSIILYGAVFQCIAMAGNNFLELKEILKMP